MAGQAAHDLPTDPAPGPPRVQLGNLADDGIAPAVAAITERAVRRRPSLAADLQIEIELAVLGPHPPVRIAFGNGRILVEDGPAIAPDLRVEGTLGDLVSLMVAPLGVGGVPSLVDRRGRAALGKVARRRVRLSGRVALMRRVLQLMRF